MNEESLNPIQFKINTKLNSESCCFNLTDSVSQNNGDFKSTIKLFKAAEIKHDSPLINILSQYGSGALFES